MKKLILATLLTPFLAGCVSHVIWDGYQPAQEYKIHFVDESEKPVSGVAFTCYADKDTFASGIAKQLNSSATKSDASGVLVLSHNGSQVAGSYKELGPFQWDFSGPQSPICEFTFNEVMFYSGVINSFNKPVTVVVRGSAR